MVVAVEKRNVGRRSGGSEGGGVVMAEFCIVPNAGRRELLELGLTGWSKGRR